MPPTTPPFPIRSPIGDTGEAFALPGELTRGNAESARRALAGWIATLDPKATLWRIDASGVEHADEAGVHLLLAASRGASAAGARLRLESPSAALRRASEQLGIAPIVLGTLDPQDAA